jgi:hypothetical protein
MVIPLAEPGVDQLTLLTRRGAAVERQVIAPCRFVPLVGEQGFSDPGR